jgi:hypothetical protein
MTVLIIFRNPHKRTESLRKLVNEMKLLWLESVLPILPHFHHQMVPFRLPMVQWTVCSRNYVKQDHKIEINVIADEELASRKSTKCVLPVEKRCLILQILAKVVMEIRTRQVYSVQSLLWVHYQRKIIRKVKMSLIVPLSFYKG